MRLVEILTIPTYADQYARWEMSVDLSMKRYKFYVSYNSRQEAWMLSLSDVNDNLLLGGIRLVPGVSFLEKYRASVPDLPPGELCLADKDGMMSTAEVTRDNLSSRFALIYKVYEEDE